MKIKTQFVIFMSGIIFIPLVIMLIVGIIQYYNRPERLFIPGYDEISQLSEAEIDPHDWSVLEFALKHVPNSVEIAVFNKDFFVLYSTIDEMAMNTYFDECSLSNLIKASGSKYLYQIDSALVKSKNQLFVVTRMLRHKKDKPVVFINRYTVLLIVFIGLIVFCSVMLILIIRSITNSVTSLEKVTRQISQGNLDEEVIVKGSNEITSLGVSLNKMRLGLKEDQQRKARFIMGVSHDLRTPVALIKGYTEALYDGIAEDPQMKQKSFEIIGSKITQLEDMIDELINFVKLDTGEWRQNLQKRKLFPFLMDFSKRLKSDGNLLKRNIESNINIPDDIEVYFDEKLFLRALENLTGNALRYTDEGGTIHFNVELKNNFLFIVVADNGRGIKKDDLPFIFDPFFRGSNSRREKGSGLGLAVVKTVINSHGWDIDVASEADEFTKFIISIPINS